MVKTLFSIFSTLLVAGIAFGGDLLKPGQPAPDFALPDGNGKIHRLSDYRGKMVVLYFYPKDFTPGCTAEACNLRDNYQSLTEKGLVILGVSYDTPQKHQEFASKYNLPFPILSDTTKTVAQAYGAKGGMFGFIGPKRITYLIDEGGRILHVFDKVQTKSHAQQILDFLKQQ